MVDEGTAGVRWGSECVSRGEESRVRAPSPVQTTRSSRPNVEKFIVVQRKTSPSSKIRSLRQQ